MENSFLRVPLAESLGAEVSRFDFSFDACGQEMWSCLFSGASAPSHTFYSSEKWKLLCLKVFSPIDKVREIETADVVANDKVRIDFADKLAPSVQEVNLAFERQHLRAQNISTFV